MKQVERIAGRTRPRVGIAGSLSGHRVAHAPFFHAARNFLQRRAVPVQLGDDASTPEQALALAHEFERSGVGLVIGHFNSDCARVVMPFYRTHGMALLLPAASDTALDIGSGVYRLCAHDAAQARTVSDWLHARATAPLAVEVRVDRSDYAKRLLQCLHTELGPGIESVLDTANPASPSAAFCVVLAVAHQALEFMQRSHADLARTTTIFSDEADITAFSDAARHLGASCSVVTPDPSYEALLMRACGLAVQWHESKPRDGDFAGWVRTQGYFLASGEARHAAWVARACAHPRATRGLLETATQLH